MTQLVVMFSACNDEAKAKLIAHQLIEQRLAGCVNVVPGMTSVYRWNDQVQEAREFLLIIKSQRDHVPSIRQALHELSGYEVPELVAAEIIDGSAPYLDWLTAETKPLATETTTE